MRDLAEIHLINSASLICFSSLIKGQKQFYVLLESRYKEVLVRYSNEDETIYLVDDLDNRIIGHFFNDILPRILESGASFILFNN